MKHLIGIEQLSKGELYRILDNAQSFVEVSTRDLKKVPALRGKTIINLFLEPSTRTRTSFEIAGKRLSADVINIGAGESSITKGESLFDTARTLQAMAPDVLVLRHKESGAPMFLSSHLRHSSIINAGDGMHEHPTQALLDCLSLMQHFKGRQQGIEGLIVAIVGDIRHSRVARSNIWAHRLLGNQVNLVGPPTLLPNEFGRAEAFGSTPRLYHDLESGLEGADVVMVLRMQLERQNDNFVPSLDEYSREFCVTERVLAKKAPQAVVLHPGPANRGVEIASSLLDGQRSLVDRQVTNGVAVRMAVLFELATQVQEDPLDAAH